MLQLSVEAHSTPVSKTTHIHSIKCRTLDTAALSTSIWQSLTYFIMIASSLNEQQMSEDNRTYKSVVTNSILNIGDLR